MVTFEDSSTVIGWIRSWNTNVEPPPLIVTFCNASIRMASRFGLLAVVFDSKYSRSTAYWGQKSYRPFGKSMTGYGTRRAASSARCTATTALARLSGCAPNAVTLMWPGACASPAGDAHSSTAPTKPPPRVSSHGFFPVERFPAGGQ